MDIRWFKDLKTKDQKEQRRKELLSYRTAFDELDTLLDSLKKAPANRNYSEANWAFNQIATNEYNQVLADIRKLLKE